MAANVIIFDGSYTSEQIQNINKANSLIEQATKDIQRAVIDHNWKCPEAKTFDSKLNAINVRLTRIRNGFTETAQVLNKGLQEFTELENRAASQADGLSEAIKTNSGTDGSNRTDGKSIKLPLTILPPFIFNPRILPPAVFNNIFMEFFKKWLDYIRRRRAAAQRKAEEQAKKLEKFFYDNFPWLDKKDTSPSTPSTPAAEPESQPQPQPTPTPASAAEPEPQPEPEPTPTQDIGPVATQADNDKWGWNTENLPFSHSTPDPLGYEYSNSSVKVNTKMLYNSWAGENRVNCVYYARARYAEVNGLDAYPYAITETIHDPEYIKNGNCVVRFDGHSVYVEHYDAANDVVWFSDSNMGSHPDGALQSMSFEEFKNFKGGFQYAEGRQ